MQIKTEISSKKDISAYDFLIFNSKIRKPVYTFTWIKRS